MAQLGTYELEKFDDIYSDAKWLEGKTARKTNGRTEVEATPGIASAKAWKKWGYIHTLLH